MARNSSSGERSSQLKFAHGLQQAGIYPSHAFIDLQQVVYHRSSIFVRSNVHGASGPVLIAKYRSRIVRCSQLRSSLPVGKLQSAQQGFAAGSPASRWAVIPNVRLSQRARCAKRSRRYDCDAESSSRGDGWWQEEAIESLEYSIV